MRYLTVAANSVNLSMLGVPEQFQDLPPSPSSFPRGFNPKARSIWESLFKENLVEVPQSKPTNSEVWYETIKAYLRYCADLRVPPFPDAYDREDNSRLLSFLVNRRHKIVKFLDRIGLLTNIRLSAKATREFVFAKDGSSALTIRSSIGFTGYSSPVELERWLRDRKVGFKKAVGGVLYARIDATTTVFVRILNSFQSVLSYEIRTSIRPYHPQHTKPLSTDQWNRYLEKEVWLPMVRSTRFLTIKRKNCLF